MSENDSKKSGKRLELIIGSIALAAAVIAAFTKFFPGATNGGVSVVASGNGSNAINIPGVVSHDVIINASPKPIDPNTRDGAIEQLAKWGQPYSVSGFQAVAESGEPQVVETYLRAGMSPEAIGSGGLFVLATSIANNPRAAQIVDLFRSYHVNFHAQGGLQSPLLSDGRLDTEAFYYAASAQKPDAVTRLVTGGADPTFLLKAIKSECAEAIDPGARARISLQLKTLQEGGVETRETCN